MGEAVVIFEKLTNKQAGQVFKRLRLEISEKLGLEVTGSAFAQAAGIASSSISEYEKGQKKPSWKRIKKICKLGEISEDRLITILSENASSNNTEMPNKKLTVKFSIVDLFKLFSLIPGEEERMKLAHFLDMNTKEGVEWIEDILPEWLTHEKLQEAYYQQHPHATHDSDT